MLDFRTLSIFVIKRCRANYDTCSLYCITGKDHWQILLQARAIENTAYVVAPAQTGIHYGRRQSHGHAMVIDPWGTVLSDAGKLRGCDSTG